MADPWTLGQTITQGRGYPLNFSKNKKTGIDGAISGSIWGHTDHIRAFTGSIKMTFNLTKASSYKPRRITEDIEITTLEELMDIVREKGDIIIYKTSYKEVEDGCFDYDVEKPTICIYDDYVE